MPGIRQDESDRHHPTSNTLPLFSLLHPWNILSFQGQTFWDVASVLPVLQSFLNIENGTKDPSYVLPVAQTGDLHPAGNTTNANKTCFCLSASQLAGSLEVESISTKLGGARTDQHQSEGFQNQQLCKGAKVGSSPIKYLYKAIDLSPIGKSP